VRQHGGWIECLSTEGSGTEFRVLLPCISESLLPSGAETQGAGSLQRGTILLVDPDERARGVARYILNRHGYRVVEADSSSIAQLLWDGQARNVDVLLTDFVLPGGSGFDLANQLRQRRPDLKVIYACGSESEGADANPVLPEDGIVISKPYQSEKLIECVEFCIPAQSIDEPFGSGGTGRVSNTDKSGGTAYFRRGSTV
jgi:CheY-like chemotaxis protein